MKTDEDPEPRRDFDTHGENEAAVGYVSAVTATFLECEQFLKKFPHRISCLCCRISKMLPR